MNKDGVKKEHGQTLEELKSFARPNLDDGNRFYADNLETKKKFKDCFMCEPTEVTTPRFVMQRAQSGFQPYRGPKAVASVQVLHQAPKATRSYRSIKGYTPKNYATRPSSAAFLKA